MYASNTSQKVINQYFFTVDIENVLDRSFKEEKTLYFYLFKETQQNNEPMLLMFTIFLIIVGVFVLDTGHRAPRNT